MKRGGWNGARLKRFSNTCRGDGKHSSSSFCTAKVLHIHSEMKGYFSFKIAVYDPRMAVFTEDEEVK